MKRVFMQFVLAAAALTGICYWPSVHWWGDAGAEALVLAAGVALGAATAGLIPFLVARGKGASFVVTACLAGTTVRLIAVLGLGLAGYWAFRPAKWAYGLWLFVFYTVLLLLDTIGMVKMMRQNNPLAGGSAANANLPAPTEMKP